MTPADAYFGRAEAIIQLRESDQTAGRPSNIGACSTANSPPNINPPDEANTPPIYAPLGAKMFWTTDKKLLH